MNQEQADSKAEPPGDAPPSTAEEYAAMAARYEQESGISVTVPSGAVFRIRRLSPLQFFHFMTQHGGMQAEDSAGAALQEYQDMKGATPEGKAPAFPEVMERFVRIIASPDMEAVRIDLLDQAIEAPKVPAQDIHQADREALIMALIKGSAGELLSKKKNKT